MAYLKLGNQATRTKKIDKSSQLTTMLRFVSNHLQKNMSFWIFSCEQRIMLWMLDSSSQVAVMKCSKYEFCNLRRTCLPSFLSFDHSCQEKRWFLNQHLAQRILKRWRLQSVIWFFVLVPRPTCFGALLKEGISIPQTSRVNEPMPTKIA